MVDELGFKKELFWTPHSIKPLDFKYKFEHRFEGQNIWRLTEDFFKEERNRSKNEANNEGELMKIIHAQGKPKQVLVRKHQTKYKKFPILRKDFKQKSNLSTSDVLSTLNSLNQSDSGDAPKYCYTLTSSQHSRAPGESSVRAGRTKLLTHRKSSKPWDPSSLSTTKQKQQTIEPVKLSQKETEELLKNLDFEVRTQKLRKQSERTKSNILRGQKPKKKCFSMAKATPEVKEYAHRGSQNTFPTPRSIVSPGFTSNLTSRSHQKTMSNSVQRELTGPLPLLRWHSQEGKKRKWNCQRTVGGAVKSANEVSSNLRKAGKKNSEPSRESSPEGAAEKLVKTTKVRTIPKLTITNQLLKSTVREEVFKTDDKKPFSKVATKRNILKGEKPSVFWTPARIALLDQITDDQEMKAALMSTGDSYLKTKRLLGFTTKVKMPTKNLANQGGVKNEPDAKPNIVNRMNATVSRKPKIGTNKVTEPAAKSVPKTSADRMDETETTMKPSRKEFESDEVVKKSKTNESSKKPLTKPKFLSPTRTVKAKSPKSLNVQALLNKGIKNTNVPIKQKRPQKLSTNPKANAKLSQLTEDSSEAQEKRNLEIRRANLDHLRKILDKSVMSSEEDKMK